jgi:chromosomal replication initiator protein
MSCLNNNYSFDRFVVGPCNDFAQTAAITVAGVPAENYNPLLFKGVPAQGKRTCSMPLV